MSTPATYKIIAYHFYVSGDNDPEKAAVRFKNMLNNYNATSKHSHTESFLLAERKVYSRDSHKQDDDTAYRYGLEEEKEGLILTAKKVKRSRGKNKITLQTFFKGTVEGFVRQYAPPSSFAAGIYEIHDEDLQGNVRLYMERGNNPTEAAYKLGLMNGLYRDSFMTYATSFIRTNEDAEFHDESSLCTSSCSDYLYILEPSKEEREDGEIFILKAYRSGHYRQLFFEGTLEDFIRTFGKN